MSEESASGLQVPRQDRSQKSLDRIVVEAEKLLDGRDYGSISVREICTAASVSPSSFYARFRTKEVLLFKLHERHRSSRLAKVARHVAEVGWDDLSFMDFVRACIAIYVEDRRSHDPYFRSMMLAEVRHPSIADQRSRVDSLTMQLIRDHILARVDSDDPTLPRRLEFGIRAIAASVQAAIRPPERFSKQMGLSEKELVDELSLLFCRYTGLSSFEVDPGERALERPIARSPGRLDPREGENSSDAKTEDAS